MKKLPKGWQRVPSVTRPNRYFYRNAVRRVSVVQSFLTDYWLVQIDGRGTQSGEFSTPLTAINSVEQNDKRA